MAKKSTALPTPSAVPHLFPGALAPVDNGGLFDTVLPAESDS